MIDWLANAKCLSMTGLFWAKRLPVWTLLLRRSDQKKRLFAIRGQRLSSGCFYAQTKRVLSSKKRTTKSINPPARASYFFLDFHVWPHINARPVRFRPHQSQPSALCHNFSLPASFTVSWHKTPIIQRYLLIQRWLFGLTASRLFILKCLPRPCV